METAQDVPSCGVCVCDVCDLKLQTPPAEHTRQKEPASETKVSEEHITGKGVGASEVAAGGAVRELCELIISEHNKAKQLFHAYQSAVGDTKHGLARQLITEIVHHSGKEEIALYPVMRKVLPQGDLEVDKAKGEHQTVTDDLYKLDQMDYATKKSEFDELLSKKVMKELNEHIEDEESRILPLFEKHCSNEEADLPHPSAPREGVPAAIAHMASVPLDEAKKGLRAE